MNLNHYTYRVTWSPEDNELLGLCVEFPSLSWLAETPELALAGIRQVVADVAGDLQSNAIPSPIGMSDFGFGHHPARLAMAWHQWDSMMPVGRAMAKA